MGGIEWYHLCSCPSWHASISTSSTSRTPSYLSIARLATRLPGPVVQFPQRVKSGLGVSPTLPQKETDPGLLVYIKAVGVVSFSASPPHLHVGN